MAATHPSWEKLYRVCHSRSICLQVTRASSGPFSTCSSFTLVNSRLREREWQSARPRGALDKGQTQKASLSQGKMLSKDW